MNYSKKHLIIIATVVVALVIAGLSIWKLSQKSENLAGNDHLIPNKPLTIAGNRALSACQALPEDAVTDIYGDLGNQSYITENYVDRSISQTQLGAEDNAITTECSYDLDDGKNSTLSLQIEQFASAKKANEYWKNAADLSDGTMEQSLKNYQTLIDNGTVTGEEAIALQALLDKLNQALPNAKKQGGDTVSGLDTSILFKQNQGTFLAVYKNSLITLAYKFGDENVFDESRKISGQELARATKPIKKTFETIFTNIENPTLSQAPRATLRSAKDIAVGPTSILEPCELLNATVKNAAFGTAEQTQPVERQLLNKDTQSKRTHVNKHPILPYNQCLKWYETKSESGTERMYVSLELGYAHDAARAKANTDGVMNMQGVAANHISNIKTKADYAKFRNSPGNVYVQNVHFQKDGYAGLLTLSKTNVDGDSVAIDKAVFQKVTDLIVDRL